MKIIEAIESANELRLGNRISDDVKRKWLRSLDLKIYNEIYATHTPNDATQPDEYDKIYDTELLVPDIDAELYVWYIVSQIDAATGETDRYNMSAERFNSLYKEFSSRYNREHTPINNYRVRNVMAVGGIS
jgi:hypothetical protein